MNFFLNEVRGIGPEVKTIFNIGMDGGGTFLKLYCLLILTLGEDEDEPQVKRWSYGSGVWSKGGKEGGVKKLIIIGLCSPACVRTL